MRRSVESTAKLGHWSLLTEIHHVDFASLYRQKLEQLREEKKQQEQPN